MPERLVKGIAYLQSRGFQVKLGRSIYEERGYLAGGDQERARDLTDMFADSEVRAVFCTRGGYGTPRILDRLDFELIAGNPKILLGYSDITALQLALFARCGLVTFSGPMVAVEMGRGLDATTEDHLWQMLSSTSAPVKLTEADDPLAVYHPGRARGRLLGGCLSLVCALLGTPYLPDFSGAILFLEDVGEEPYQIDRKLMQLRLAGVLNQVSGIVLGAFEDCQPRSQAPSLSLEDVFRDLLCDLDVPVVSGLPYGHVEKKVTLPLGVEAVLDAEQGYLELLEPGVRES